MQQRPALLLGVGQLPEEPLLLPTLIRLPASPIFPTL